MNRCFGLALLLVAAGALALRYPQLDQRPMHNDEAVNAILIQGLWQDGLYQYNPEEYHGPSLYYATLPFIWLSAARDFSQLDEHTLRLAPVFFGVALILLLWLLRDGLGAGPALAAGLLTALSPAMVFYSRYFIHEMLLVFFTMGLLAAGWRYTQSRRTVWAVLAGAALGLMYATKETFILPSAAMLGAWRVGRLLDRRAPGESAPAPLPWNLRHFALGLGACALVSITLFSSFYTNATGPLNSLRSFLTYFHRAGGHSPHVHPSWFYLERLAFFHPAKGLVWSEGLILLLAVAGMVAAFTGRGLGRTNPRLARFLAVYTLLLTAAYAAISYKTPWCMLGFLHGLILLAGIGVSVVLRIVPGTAGKIAAAVCLLAATAHLGWEAWRASFALPADRRNPYVYAQTVPDILNLMGTLEDLVRSDPRGFDLPVKVMAPESEYWPLPYYLRKFKRVGYWGRMPEDPYAPIMIVSSKFDAALDEKSNKRCLMARLSELRPEVFFECYVEFNLWKKYVETRPRPKEE